MTVFAGLAIFVSSSVAADGDLKFEAQLIWGTNDSQPADSKLKPINPKLEEKLKKSPFKWQYYYEVSRKKFSVSLNAEKKEEMSKQCAINVKNIGGKNKIEVQLFGKGKLVEKRMQELPKGKCLLIGGEAENTTSWFVVLEQAE